MIILFLFLHCSGISAIHFSYLILYTVYIWFTSSWIWFFQEQIIPLFLIYVSLFLPIFFTLIIHNSGWFSILCFPRNYDMEEGDVTHGCADEQNQKYLWFYRIWIKNNTLCYHSAPLWPQQVNPVGSDVFLFGFLSLFFMCADSILFITK